MSRHLLTRVLCVTLGHSCVAMVCADDAGTGVAPGSPVSTVNAYWTETDVLTALGEAALNDCFLTSIRFDIDTCTYSIGPVQIEMLCTRVDMNDPMALIEGADRQGLLSIYTNDLKLAMEMQNSGCSPLEKTMVQRVGDLVSASASTQGHAINLFLTATLIKQLVTSVTFDVLCSPAFEYTHFPGGYAFASEGDQINGSENGNWRAVVSNYWLMPWLIPFTSTARTLETAGLCGLDWFKIFCHGGWGTVYPATGTNPAESQFMNLIDSMWDALNPTYAPYMTYGPLHVRLGAELVSEAHSAKSTYLGLQAMNALLTRGGYIQPLFPAQGGHGSSVVGASAALGGGSIGMGQCINTADVANDQNPASEGWMAQVSSKASAEANQNILLNAPYETDQGRVVSIALWPRFTCCNYCAGSDEAPARHLLVGRGFWPQLIPGP